MKNRIACQVECNGFPFFALNATTCACERSFGVPDNLYGQVPDKACGNQYNGTILQVPEEYSTSNLLVVYKNKLCIIFVSFSFLTFVLKQIMHKFYFR